jgi:polyhydroxybutyrate depolymerase
MRVRIRSIVASVALLAATVVSLPANAAEPFVVGGSRPVTVQLPADTSHPSPLLVMLHSASTSGAHQEKYMKLGPVAKRLGMIYIAPDGTVGKDGRRVWNAAKACCQKSGDPVDDIGYLNSLIDEIDAKYPVDRNRIYFVGHSNGAFMSLAFACSTGKVAGVVSLAGALDTDNLCASTHPFAFLHIHGVADPTIRINGGALNHHSYTSALETLNRIATVNKCVTPKFSQVTFTKKDFDPTIPGLETTVQKLTDCQAPIIYWRVARGLHSPKLPVNYAEQILTFLSGAKLTSTL